MVIEKTAVFFCAHCLKYGWTNSDIEQSALSIIFSCRPLFRFFADFLALEKRIHLYVNCPLFMSSRPEKIYHIGELDAGYIERYIFLTWHYSAYAKKSILRCATCKTDATDLHRQIRSILEAAKLFHQGIEPRPISSLTWEPRAVQESTLLSTVALWLTSYQWASKALLLH